MRVATALSCVCLDDVQSFVGTPYHGPIEFDGDDAVTFPGEECIPNPIKIVPIARFLTGSRDENLSDSTPTAVPDISVPLPAAIDHTVVIFEVKD